MGHLVEFINVGRDFPPTARALRSATLSIDGKERVAIVGPSGSGKSTLLAILGLLDRPTSGTYLLDGSDMSSLDDGQRTRTRRAHLSFIFQAFHLIPHLNALENVVEGLRIAGASRATRRDRAVEALDSVGLADRALAMPNTMSGGEQQRVAIARAVARTPKLLLCDEPTGNLDSKSSALVMRSILGPTLDETAVVIVTHDEAIAKMCDRTIHVIDGIATENR